MASNFFVSDTTQTPFTSGSAGVQIVRATATPYAGSPVGAVAGLQGNFVFDTQSENVWTCVSSGTSGSAQWQQVLLYVDLINGSIAPKFSVIQRNAQQEPQNWLPNSSFLYGFAGWQTPPTGVVIGTDNESTYAQYNGTSTTAQSWNSESISAGWIQPSGTCTLSGWLSNVASSGDSSIAVSCFESNGTFISNIAVSTLTSGDAWTYVSATETFPANTAYVQISLGWMGSSSGSNIAFSRIKLEEGSIATLWSDEASAQLFQNGQFSPVFDNLQADGNLTVIGTSTLSTTTVPNATNNNNPLPLGQAFQLLEPTSSAIINPVSLQTIVIPNFTSSGTITIEPGNIIGQLIEVFSGEYSVTVSSNVSNGNPAFLLPGGESVFSWNFSADVLDQFIQLRWDGLDWLCHIVGQPPSTRQAIFTSNGTFQIPYSVTQVYVSGCAGGGGGASGNYGPNTSGNFPGGGGGGAGQPILKQSFSVTPGDIWTINIGSAGTGGVMTSGTSGTNTTITNSDGTVLTLIGGGAGGNIYLNLGGIGYPNGGTGFDENGGTGASGPFGGGGNTNSPETIGSAYGYGSGGSGGYPYIGTDTTASEGGNGAPGIIIIEW